MQKTGIRQALRLLILIVLVTLFAGMLAHSARVVRYPVNGRPTSETTITDLSLTHSVERGTDGKLTNPYAEPPEPVVEPKPAVAKPVAVTPAVVAPAGESTSKQELKAKAVVKKPAPKKPAPKKPAKKKPVPKKPPVKKPAPRKPAACPT